MFLKDFIKDGGKQFLLFLLIVNLIFLVSANSDDVHISPSDPYTTDDLVCSWDFSGDNYSVVWLKDSVVQESLNNVTSVNSSHTAKNENWTCNVTVLDSSNQGATSVDIRNSAPNNPVVVNSSGETVSSGFELYEGREYVFTFNTTDVDGDTLSYYLGTPIPDFCEMTDEVSGEASCLVTHEDVAVSNSSDNGPEEIKHDIVEFWAKETGSAEKVASNRDINFTLVPVNNQPSFVDPIGNQSLNALSPWSFELVGEDEELDYPLNFSIASTDGLSGLMLINETNTTANLTFEHGQPTNEHVGNWSIVLNLTDNGSSSNPPSSISFNLEVLRTNEVPYFTTNFSNISGTQGESFLLNITAEDLDENDTLDFFILRNESANPFCDNDTFPWSSDLEVINSSSNASALLNVSNLTNDHVICKDVLLEVHDQTGSHQSVPVHFNISNINDAPVIHEMSYYENNFLNQNNLSELLVGLHSTDAIYKVNATDVDQLTYDANNSGALSFSTNNSNFSIDDEGVLDLDFSDNSMVGEWSVLITVEDNGDPSLNDSFVMNVNITENSAPVVSVPSNLSFNQSDNVTLFFNVSDTIDDNFTIFLESDNSRFNTSIYNSSLDLFSFNESDGKNITTWAINLSEWVDVQYSSFSEGSRPSKDLFRNELVGAHNITIRAYDSFGAHDSTSKDNLEFNISNENDVPFFDTVTFDNISDGDEIEFPPIIIGNVYSRTLYFTDFDLYLPDDIVDENLSFNVINWSDLSDVSFDKVDENSARVSFIPNSNGTNFITLGVEDSEGEGENVTINFEVSDEIDPPQIVSVSPFFEDNNTVLDFINTSDVSNPLHVEWVENSSLTFDINATFEEKIGEESNQLNVEWFVNGESQSYLENIDPAVNSSFDHFFDFFSEGSNNVTAVVSDFGSSVNWTWLVDVENVNRPPIFCEDSLEDLEIEGSMFMPNHLSYLEHQRFYDPDDDPENDGLTEVVPCNVSRNRSVWGDLKELESLNFSYEFTTPPCDADFEFSGANLTITGYSEGTCRVRFNATDEEGESVVSDEIEVQIWEALEQDELIVERQVPVTEQVNVPIEEEVDVPTPTKIIYPGKLVFYENRSVEVPLVIKNNWTEDFSDISLSADVLNESSIEGADNMSISLSQDSIDELEEDESVNVTLVVEDYRVFEPLRINILANVSDPSFADSETLIIAGLEMMGDDPQGARALVTYARDLLTSSPQCAELNDLLNDAQGMLDQGLSEDALSLVDAAINGCKHLMSEEEIRRNEKPSALEVGLDFSSSYWSEIVFGSIAVIFLAVVFYVVAYVRVSLKKKEE